MNEFWISTLVGVYVVVVLKTLYDLLRNKTLSIAEKVILSFAVITLSVLGISIAYRYQHNKRFSLRNKKTTHLF